MLSRFLIAAALVASATAGARANAMTLEEAQAQLALAPIQPFMWLPGSMRAAIRSNPDPMRPTASDFARPEELERFYEALIVVASELSQQPTRALEGFVFRYRVEIAYWLQFFLGERGLDSALDLLSGRRDGTGPLRDAFLAFKASFGPEEMARSLRRARIQAGREVFGPPPARLDVPFIHGAPDPRRREDFGPLPARTFADLVYELQIYRSLGESAHLHFRPVYRDLTPASIRALIALHQGGTIDLAMAFRASLPDYAQAFLSPQSGSPGSRRYASRAQFERSVALGDPAADAWLDAVYETLGTSEFLRALRLALVPSSLRLPTGAAQELEAQRSYLFQPLSYLDDGVFCWAALAAPRPVRDAMIRLYIDLSINGKNWSAWDEEIQAHDSGEIASFQALMREAVLRQVENDAPAVSDQAAWNYLVSRNRISSDVASLFREMLAAFEAQRAAMRAEMQTRLSELRDPPRLAAIGRRLLGVSTADGLALAIGEASLESRLQVELETHQARGFRFEGVNDRQRDLLRRILPLFVEPPSSLEDFSAASDGQLADGILRMNALFRPDARATLRCAAFKGN